MTEPVPSEIEDDRVRARRLEWWTLAWMTTIVIAMGAAMGQSQAMRTALLEDVLSIVPAIVMLIALRFEQKEPTALYNWGFDRVQSIAFLVSAVALTGVGGFLLYEAAVTLIAQDHVTIPPVVLFGQEIWLGWLMLAALLYSVVPPLILGRMKLPVARRLDDDVLHTDAMMQKADWMTGLAGAAGVIGIGLGYWWADAAAAAFISLSILRDGLTALRVAAAELADGVPHKLGEAETAEDAVALREALQQRWPGCDVRMREVGRYIFAQVRGPAPTEDIVLQELWPGPPEREWRFAELSFVPMKGWRRSTVG